MRINAKLFNSNMFWLAISLGGKMNGCKYIEKLVEHCKIFYGEDLISEEQILKNYLSFFSNQFEQEKKKVSFSLHTGSLCFDIAAVVAVMLGSIAYNMSTNDEIIKSFRKGDLVLYKNSRYRWMGIIDCDGKKCLALEKDGRGKTGNNIIYSGYESNKHLIKPYYGMSKRTDSRGIRRGRDVREKFLAWLLEVSKQEIPSEFDISVVVVANRETIVDILKNTRIEYADGEKVCLLDIIPAAYYTANGEEYSIGENPTKAEAVLKVTGKLSEARELILNKNINKTVGLLVMGAEGIAKNGSELPDLLRRKTLRFAHVMGALSEELGQEIVESYSRADVFVCTKEFLKENSSIIKVENALTEQLNNQVNNILLSDLNQHIINDGGWSWEEYLSLKNELYKIRQSDWKHKEEFVLSSYALINLFNLAAFSMKSLVDAINRGTVSVSIMSPSDRLKKLAELKNLAGNLYDMCDSVTNALKNMYNELLCTNGKKKYLDKYLKENSGKKIVIIVPKAYYITLLNEIYGNMLFWRNVRCITISKYNLHECYDKILIVGNLRNRKFDMLQCHALNGVDVILYPCEENFILYQKKKILDLTCKLNRKQGIKTNSRGQVTESNIDKVVEQEMSDLDKYIENLSLYQFHQVMTSAVRETYGTINAEVQVVGRFETGEQIWFSKYYSPIVYDADTGQVSEEKVDQLESGDILIFVKRNNYTSNVVDVIYDKLIEEKKLSENVVVATEMANYWKDVLRMYKEIGNYTYQEIASQMKKYGCSLQAVTIRQWLAEESHIVGPQKEETLRQIALLTGDEKLNTNLHAYYEACKLVRHQRKEILNLIGRAITDKLEGNQPQQGSIFSIVYDNVENLSETKELENIMRLENVINVPINLANRPVLETEVLL